MKLTRFSPFLLLCLITIAFYWKILLVHQFSLLTGYEGVNQAYSWFDYWVRTLRTGALPIWDPFTFSGHAFTGESQTGAFYPPYLLFLLAPFRHGVFQPQLYHYFYAFSHVMGAWFMFALARELGLSRFAALISGICFSLGGIVGRLQEWPHLLGSGIWLPLILLLLIRALEASAPLTSLLYASLSGLALAMSILAGGVHFVIMQAIVVVSAAVFHVSQLRTPDFPKRRIWTRTMVIAAIVLVFAVCGGAAQAFPSAEYSRHAYRFLPAGVVPASDRIPYGDIGDMAYPLSIITAIFASSSVIPGSGEYINPYIGVFPFVLAVIGFIQCRRHPWVRYCTRLAAAAFVCSMGNLSLLHGLLYALVPFFSIAREADRFMYLADFGVALLAGYGIDALLSGASAVSWETFERIFRWAAIISAIALVAPALVGAKDTNIWVSLSLLLVIASWAMYRYLRGGHDTIGIRFLIVSLILFDLSAFDWSAANRQQVAGKGADNMEHLLHDSRGVVDFLRAQPGLFRVDVWANWAPNIGDVYKVETTWGSGVTVDKDYSRMKAHPELLNTRYRIMSAAAKDPGPVYADSQWKVYKIPGYYPRGWLVHQTQVEPDSEKLFALLDKPDPDLHRTALLNAPLKAGLSPAPTGVSAENVVVRRPGNNSLEVDSYAAGQALLVLSETFYPGWHATVNGKPAAILKVDGDLRGIVVTAGYSRVRLEFEPLSVYLGLILSLAAFLTATIIFVVFRRTADRAPISRAAEFAVR